ncbi:hypothetical protein V6N11_047812 [Hibiscus sabdariffa]|uniref:Uncharacterized protein n=1 Tax=Hibiscus sabdariffa TaxID=183260 RepID=A0ABR2P824_9ROSI
MLRDWRARICLGSREDGVSVEGGAGESVGGCCSGGIYGGKKKGEEEEEEEEEERWLFHGRRKRVSWTEVSLEAEGRDIYKREEGRRTVGEELHSLLLHIGTATSLITTR